MNDKFKVQQANEVSLMTFYLYFNVHHFTEAICLVVENRFNLDVFSEINDCSKIMLAVDN